MRHTYLLSIISILTFDNQHYTSIYNRILRKPSVYNRIGTEPERLPTKSGRAKDRLI